MIIEPFDARLDRTLNQPLAVAFSGGGDSLTALIVTLRWAKACGRPVIALHVDHGLQSESGAWAARAADVAAALSIRVPAVSPGMAPSRRAASPPRRGAPATP